MMRPGIWPCTEAVWNMPDSTTSHTLLKKGLHNQTRPTDGPNKRHKDCLPSYTIIQTCVWRSRSGPVIYILLHCKPLASTSHCLCLRAYMELSANPEQDLQHLWKKSSTCSTAWPGPRMQHLQGMVGTRRHA